MDNCNFKLFFLITLVFVVAMNGLPVSSKTVSGAGENPGGFSGNFTDAAFLTTLCREVAVTWHIQG